MTEHTPGPWHLEKDDTGGPFTGWPSVVADKHLDTTIIHRAGFKQEYWGDTSQRRAIANARLIAAAPDLLAVCKAILAIEPDQDGDRIIAPEFEELPALVAAIAKATGSD